MDFKEVENINKEVIVSIKDRIHVLELVHRMGTWGFTKMTIEGITAEIKNYGESHAAPSFLEAIKKKPKSFPKMMAALQHTGQEEIYEKFLKEIRKYYRNNQTRLVQVLSLIEQEEELLSEDHHEDIDSHPVLTTGNGAEGQGLQAGNTDQQSQDINRRVDQPPSRIPRQVGVASGSQPVVQVLDRSNTQASSSSLSSLDNNIPGAAGNIGQGIQNISSETPGRLDQKYAGKSISALKANVYKMLGKELEKKLNMNGDDNEPWWNHIINNGDLDISRKEQRSIGKHGSPGVEFLDIMDDRGYTLQDLERLLTQFQINEALRVLLTHQDKVIEDKHPVQTDQNNLNSNQEAKADQSKDLNISLPPKNVSEGPKKQNTLSAQLSAQPLQEQAYARESNRNSGQSDVQLVTQTSDVSLDSNTVNLFLTIEDESMKGTVAVPAHGDQTGKQSQPNPEQNAQMLRNDRLHQFDTDPEALERTSFIPVNQQQNADGRNDVSRNIPVGPGNNEVQMGNFSLGQNNTDENTNTQSVPADQGESSGDIPIFSQLRSVDSSLAEQSEEPDMRPEGVVDVLPRSFTTYEAAQVDVLQTTGVTFVSPSVSTVSSEEVTVGPGNNEVQVGNFSLGQNNTDENTNTQSVPADQGESSGNIPIFSQLRSADSSLAEQSEEPDMRPEGVVDVLPRNLTTYEAAQVDVLQTTGVTFVSPSVSTVCSEELTEDHSTRQSGAISDRLSLGSLNEPDIIPDSDLETQTLDTENVTLDFNEKTEN